MGGTRVRLAVRPFVLAVMSVRNTPIPVDRSENEVLRRRRAIQRRRFVGALVFVGIGLFIIWFTKAVIGVTGDGLFVAELFIAVFVFLILTGQISELTAGGVTAKFRELANDPVVPEAPSMIEPEEAYIIQKRPVEALEELRREGLEERGPVILSLTLGADPTLGRPTGRYQLDAVREYGHFLTHFERFHFVVFIGRGDRLLGYIPYAQFERALEDERTGRQLIDAINLGAEQTVASLLPDLITSTVTVGTSNAEALDLMTQLKLEAMIVVDVASRPIGVIEREQLTSQMLLAITRP
jgi:hypothetical protein